MKKVNAISRLSRHLCPRQAKSLFLSVDTPNVTLCFLIRLQSLLTTLHLKYHPIHFSVSQASKSMVLMWNYAKRNSLELWNWRQIKHWTDWHGCWWSSFKWQKPFIGKSLEKNQTNNAISLKVALYSLYLFYRINSLLLSLILSFLILLC